MDKREVTTGSGFHCLIDEDALDDFELLEALADMDTREDGVKMISGFRNALEMLLGEEQKDALYAHIKEKYGRVKTTILKDELLQIFASLGEDKKK